MCAAPRSSRSEPPTEGAPVEVEPEDEGSGRRSYKDRKAESNALVRLARTLVGAKPSVLAELPLPDDVREAVRVARGLERAARVRELRRVVGLLRAHDITSMDALERSAGRARRNRAARERDHEAWRERLVSEGDRALAELVARHPRADAQRLRQLVRQARREPGSDKARQALRDVLRLVRQACEADEGGSPDAEAQPGVPQPAGVDVHASTPGPAPDAEAAPTEGEPEG